MKYTGSEQSYITSLFLTRKKINLRPFSYRGGGVLPACQLCFLTIKQVLSGCLLSRKEKINNCYF